MGIRSPRKKPALTRTESGEPQGSRLDGCEHHVGNQFRDLASWLPGFLASLASKLPLFSLDYAASNGRAVSSAVEHCFHTAGVTGSIPVPPTNKFSINNNRLTAGARLTYAAIVAADTVVLTHSRIVLSGTSALERSARHLIRANSRTQPPQT